MASASSYAGLTADELRKEVDRRELKVKASAKKPDLVAALEHDDKFKLTIDGVEHVIDFDDFESWEIEFVEDLMDAPLGEIDFRRWKAIRGLVYLIRHRADASVSFADFADLKPADLMGVQNGDRPTEGAKDAPAAAGAQQ